MIFFCDSHKKCTMNSNMNSEQSWADKVEFGAPMNFDLSLFPPDWKEDILQLEIRTRKRVEQERIKFEQQLIRPYFTYGSYPQQRSYPQQQSHYQQIPQMNNWDNQGWSEADWYNWNNSW